MDQVLNTYYANNAKKLHSTVDKILLKFGGLSNKDLDDLSIDEFKNICDVFDEDIYEIINVETCVNKRNTIGAPGIEAMKQVIALNDIYINENKGLK